MSLGRILVAVDGSNASFNASTYAIDVAKRNDAELIVLYIASPATYIDLGYANVGRMREIESSERKHAQHEVDKVKQKGIENKVTVNTEVLIKHTSIVEEIVEYAEKKKVDMIVVGSRGMTGFKKLLLGSVATGVVTYSHCPVLVVK